MTDGRDVPRPGRGFPYPRPWADEDAADEHDAWVDEQWIVDEHDQGPLDVEWSTEQTFAGEFGTHTAFGEAIE